MFVSRRYRVELLMSSMMAGVLLTSVVSHVGHVEPPPPAVMPHFHESLRAWADEMSDLLRDTRFTVITGTQSAPPPNIIINNPLE